MASNMLLDFKFSSRNSSTGNSRTMDSMGLVDKAAFILSQGKNPGEEFIRGLGFRLPSRLPKLSVLYSRLSLLAQI